MAPDHSDRLARLLGFSAKEPGTRAPVSGPRVLGPGPSIHGEVAAQKKHPAILELLEVHKVWARPPKPCRAPWVPTTKRFFYISGELGEWAETEKQLGSSPAFLG